jgi:ankyrin repeat protein
MMACVAKNVIAVEKLLKLGANASYVNEYGISPPICAVRIAVPNHEDQNSIPHLQDRSGLILDLLLSCLVDVNQSDLVSGNTPLHVAILSQNQVACKKLLTRTYAHNKRIL